MLCQINVQIHNYNVNIVFISSGVVVQFTESVSQHDGTCCRTQCVITPGTYFYCGFQG